MPQPGPDASMTTPISGAPIALPTVSAAACRPIACPRRDAGTARLIASTVDAIVGAQATPAGITSRASTHQLPAVPTGMLSAPSASRSTVIGSGRRIAPCTKPPSSEEKHQMITTTPAQVISPCPRSTATTATSVADSTTQQAAHTARISTKPEVNQRAPAASAAPPSAPASSAASCIPGLYA